MKKAISVLLCIILIASNIFTVSAAKAPAYVSGSIKAEAGKEITVPVSIENNSGIISLRLQVVYDESVLKLISVKDKGLLAGFTEPAKEKKSPYVLRWSDALATNNNTANGEIALLTFKVAENAGNAPTEIRFEHIEANKNGENYSLQSVNFDDSIQTVSFSHLFTNYVSDNNATCTKDGTKTATCDICKKAKDTNKDGICDSCKTAADKIDGDGSAEKINTKKPARVTAGKVKSTKKKQAVVTWKQVEKANGYQVAYSTSKKFRKKATKTKFVKKYSRVKLTIKKLRSKKKYYVKVRAYKTVNGRKVYGSWSKVMTVKVK